MVALQLNLFPENEPTPVGDRNFRKTVKNRPSVRVIEPACTTQRAAHLIGISTSTLYRARKEGKAYQKGQWTAKAIGDNTWSVTHSSI